MGYSKLKNELVSGANGVDYAYRDTGGGEGAVPLVLFQHFRGNLDNWDPALIDALATARRVVTFDNAGVGGSTGSTPGTIEQMAHDAIAFLAAMGFSQVGKLAPAVGAVSMAPPPPQAAPPPDRSGHGPGVGAPQLVGGHAVRVTSQVLHDDRRERPVGGVAQDGHREGVDEVGVRPVDYREVRGVGRR